MVRWAGGGQHSHYTIVEFDAMFARTRLNIQFTARHWVVVNIPAAAILRGDLSEGQTLTPYAMPGVSLGETHRYMFLLFGQAAHIDFEPFAGDQWTVPPRMAWDPFVWAKRHGLGAPLAVQSMLVPGCMQWGEDNEGRYVASWGCASDRMDVRTRV